MNNKQLTTKLPRVLVVSCEGEKTEPQYLKAVIKHKRVHQGVARVRIFPKQGQHKLLVDNAAAERDKVIKELRIEPDDVEAWAVCDMDRMDCTFQELETYANKMSVRIAFSNPRFEVFLLQHLTQSSTNLTGKHLEALLTRHMRKKGINRIYDKTDISWFYDLIDNDPQILEQAIKNCSRISNPANTPHVTAHLLLSRLIDIAP